VVNSWPGGFQGSVDVRNSGSSAISGWRVTWTYATGQTITQLWSGSYTQTGGNVSVTNAGYNGNLAAGASTSFGFNANGPSTAPTNVTCTAS
jgi:cellulase/cellobiase CelA1